MLSTPVAPTQSYLFAEVKNKCFIWSILKFLQSIQKKQDYKVICLSSIGKQKSLINNF